ncbi:MAG: cytidine deaminase [Endomicrobium sp.]|nr:cytidine deaminase [Endomicrobium sp.]
MNAKYQNLLSEAKKASENSYSPYSSFAVGSAVLSASGRIYLGANVENASYGLSNCAERSALFNAFSNGERNVKAAAVWTRKGGVFPCGACRQVLFELAPSADIIINGSDGAILVLKVSDLMPFSFGKENLK